jgi:hypothetical protein
LLLSPWLKLGLRQGQLQVHGCLQHLGNLPSIKGSAVAAGVVLLLLGCHRCGGSCQVDCMLQRLLRHGLHMLMPTTHPLQLLQGSDHFVRRRAHQQARLQLAEAGGTPSFALVLLLVVVRRRPSLLLV